MMRGAPLTYHQLRAAMVLADLDLRDLPDDVRLSLSGLDETRDAATMEPETLEALTLALVSRGVEFSADGWVRHTDDRGPDGAQPGLDSPSVLLSVAERLEVVRVELTVVRVELAAERQRLEAARTE